MASYLLHFTKGLVPVPGQMPQLARDLARSGLYGIPSTATLRHRICPGDLVVVTVGSPHRVFVADAMVESGYHRFDEEERTRRPQWMNLDHGIGLRDVHTWSEPVPIMSVWPRTVARASTNKTALFYGTLIALKPGDDAAILAAAGRAASNAPVTPTGEGRDRAAVQRAGMARPAVPAARSKPIPVGPEEAATRVRRALARAEHSPPWLPERVAHADWGTAPAKRAVAAAELQAGAFRTHAPSIFGNSGQLLDDMGLHGPRGRTLLGFDFPIGLSRAYAAQAGADRYVSWLRSLPDDATLFDIAADIADVSPARPFFPQNIAVKSPGIKSQFREALGVSAEDVLRRCDRKHCTRNAASEMFWCLGASGVGKATVAGWRDILRPALQDSNRRFSVWPFDGQLQDLLATSDAVLVETYPADVYLQLGLSIGRPGASKTRQEDRRADATRLLDWCAEHAVLPDEHLTEQILDGFGPSSSGEDPFDAVVGLFGMVDTLHRAVEPDLPDDPAIRSVEGWMFGQHASCP
jgi:hypothetical protein